MDAVVYYAECRPLPTRYICYTRGVSDWTEQSSEDGNTQVRDSGLPRDRGDTVMAEVFTALMILLVLIIGFIWVIWSELSK